MMNAFLYYGLFLAPAFPPRTPETSGVSWFMTLFAIGGLILLAADIRGRLKTRAAN